MNERRRQLFPISAKPCRSIFRAHPQAFAIFWIKPDSPRRVLLRRERGQ